MTNTFPANPMEPARLIDRLMDRVSASNTFIGLSIRDAVNNKVPYRQILATVKSQFGDNVDAGIALVGEDLFNDLMEFNG